MPTTLKTCGSNFNLQKKSCALIFSGLGLRRENPLLSLSRLLDLRHETGIGEGILDWVPGADSPGHGGGGRVLYQGGGVVVGGGIQGDVVLLRSSSLHLHLIHLLACL